MRGSVIENAVVENESDTLTQAVTFAATLGNLVTITDGVVEIVGVFGVNSVEDGICPDGSIYTWKKRRI